MKDAGFTSSGLTALIAGLLAAVWFGWMLARGELKPPSSTTPPAVERACSEATALAECGESH